MNELVDLGYTAVEWSSDSQDWYSRSADRVLVNTLTDTRPGSIILMHSTGVNLEDTVKALPELIYTLGPGVQFCYGVRAFGQAGLPADRIKNSY